MESDLLESLLGQHQLLRNHLTKIHDLALAAVSTDLLPELNLLKDELVTHWKIEDGQFYPIILEKMRAKGMATQDTEIFIKEMQNIAIGVMKFFDQYNQEAVIKSGQFLFDFGQISEQLLLRISSEEEGVYMYWQL